MNRRTKIAVFSILAGGIAFTATHLLKAQQAASSAPAVPPGYYASRTVTPHMAPGMKVTDLGRGPRTYKVRFAKGDSIMSGLTDFAEMSHVKNAHFTGVGAIDHGDFGWSDPPKKAMKKIEINEEAEIVSFTGTISRDNNGKPVVHGHISVAFQDGTVHGGHLVEAHVGIMCEVYVTEEDSSEEVKATN